MIAPVATPMPTSRPKANTASQAFLTMVASIVAPTIKKALPITSVQRTPSRLTLIATSGIPNSDAGLASGLFNTSQQIGGALGLAVLATLAVDATQETLTGLGHEPQPAEQGQALVDGFHVAYFGSAALVAAAFFALLFLLSRSDVVAVGEGEAAAGTAAG